MTDITLYEGCWVKTRDGEIFGPLIDGAVAWVAPKMRHGSGWNDDGKCAELGEDYDVIQVYPSLSEASAANPEM